MKQEHENNEQFACQKALSFASVNMRHTALFSVPSRSNNMKYRKFQQKMAKKKRINLCVLYDSDTCTGLEWSKSHGNKIITGQM